jgi:DNA mismatch endonuclease (patch repair protein)
MPKGIYKRTKPAWNKDLTKEDNRVKKYLEARNNNPKWKINLKIGCKNNRPPSRKGSKHSDETKKKCGIKPPDFSNRMKQSYIQNPELRKLRSKTQKERYENNPELRGFMRNKRYNQIFPVENTKIEILLQNELLSRNINFISHPNIDGIAQPDIVIPEFMIVVFADGCYWHNCPIHGTGKSLSPYDNGQNKLLKLRGYTVFRFWEHEIIQSPKDCIDRTMAHAQKLGKETHLILVE